MTEKVIPIFYEIYIHIYIYLKNNVIFNTINKFFYFIICYL